MNTTAKTNNRYVARCPQTAKFTVWALALTITNITAGQVSAQANLIVSEGLELIPSGGTIDFGETAPGSPVGEAYTLRNVSSLPLRISGHQLVGNVNDFTVDVPHIQLAPNGFAVMTIQFDPLQTGERSVALTIFVEDADDYDIQLIGAGLDPPALSVADGLIEILDGDTVDLGEVESGDQAGIALTVRNLGATALQFTAPNNVVVQGPAAADFDVQLAANELQPGGFAVLTIAFEPSAAGVRLATISIPSNDPIKPDFTFIVRGESLEPGAPAMELEWEGTVVQEGDTLFFGNVEVGETEATTLRIRNVGQSQLSASLLQIVGDANGDYSITVTSFSLSPGASVLGSITVTPSATGARDATLIIESNATEQPVELLLTTDGVLPADAVDCDENGIDDVEDLASGGEDCDANGTLDVCEDDSDDDGVIDACDNCPLLENADQADIDGDGIGDLCDNCEETPNPDQTDADFDVWGDACDNCPNIENAEQEDFDEDGVGDACDNCPDDANGAQTDADGDGVGDACDNCPNVQNANQDDFDADGIGDVCDNCPDDATGAQTDADGDGVGDACDNCTDVANPQQTDSNDDGIGDACEVAENGDPVDDGNPGGGKDPIDTGNPGDDDAGRGQDGDGEFDGDLEFGGQFCGAGALGMLPVMMLGLCGMRPRRRF